VNRLDPDHERLDLLSKVTSNFEVRVVILEPGCDVIVEPAEWLDALVEVDQGAVELELPSGASARFSAGDLIWLKEGTMRALPRGGQNSAVLVAVSRSSCQCPVGDA
jgi:quercetin dioxygenase-like cupin family protein